jgi:hypothetical protein
VRDDVPVSAVLEQGSDLERPMLDLDERIGGAGNEQESDGAERSTSSLGVRSIRLDSASRQLLRRIQHARRREFLFTNCQRPLALLEGLSLQLHGTELAASTVDLGFCGAQTSLSFEELASELLELHLPFR